MTAAAHKLTRREWLLATLLYVAIAVAVLRDVWFARAASVVGPAYIGPYPNGDSIQLIWFLRWTPFALQQHMDPMLTTYLNAPAGANLMWNSLMLLPGLVLSPVTLLGGAVAAANVLATLALVTCAIAACSCARRFMKPFASCLLVGALFEVCPFAMNESQGHPSIVLGAALAPAVLLLVIDVARAERSPIAGGLLLGIAAALTYYTWPESLLIVALFGVLGVVVAALVAPAALRPAAVRATRCVGLAALVALVLAAPGLVVQFLGPERLQGQLRPIGSNVVDLLNAVTPTSTETVAPAVALRAAQHWSGGSMGWDGYIGIPLLVAIAACTVYLWRRAAVRWAAVMLVCSYVLSLGPSLHIAGVNTHIPLPWALATHIPLLQNIQVPRLSLAPAFAAALLLGILVSWLIERRQYWGASLSAAAVIVTFIPAPTPADPVSSPGFFTSHDVDAVPAGSVALVVPYIDEWQPWGQLWQEQAAMRFRMPEGYVLIPPAHGEGVSQYPYPSVTSLALETIAEGGRVELNSAQRDGMDADLRRWDVRTVIVGPMPHRDVMISFLTSLLGRPPRYDQDVAAWFGLSP